MQINTITRPLAATSKPPAIPSGVTKIEIQNWNRNLIFTRLRNKLSRRVTRNRYSRVSQCDLRCRYMCITVGKARPPAALLMMITLLTFSEIHIQENESQIFTNRVKIQRHSLKVGSGSLLLGLCGKNNFCRYGSFLFWAKKVWKD